ncbi:MAG: hypothetical protein AAF682_00965 [Planctomycetota bacterium]
MPADIAPDTEFFEAMFQSIAADLAMIMDTSIAVDGLACERANKRAAGEGQVHISFKFLVHHEGVERQGSVLVPLPDAIALASYLMMMAPEEIEEQRQNPDLDRPLKEAMLEVGNFVSGAIDAVIRTWYPSDASCRSLGCQGVRADVRPAFDYGEGDELAVASAAISVEDFEPFRMVVQMPPPAA